MWSRSKSNLATTLACPECGLHQDVPKEVPFFACCSCRAAVSTRSNSIWAQFRRALRAVTSHRHSSRTIWTAPRAELGSTVRLTPCCLYYDHKCVTLGPLKSPTDEGILVGGGSGSLLGFLEVQVGKTIFRYQQGCVEDAQVLKMYDDLFTEFSTSSELDGVRRMGFTEFVNYAFACGQLVEWEVYEAMCQAIHVHSSQGLTAGDFRRIYCEFDSDVREDHFLALRKVTATPSSQSDQGGYQGVPELQMDKAVPTDFHSIPQILKGTPPDAKDPSAKNISARTSQFQEGKDKQRTKRKKTSKPHGMDELAYMGERKLKNMVHGVGHKPSSPEKHILSL